MEKLEGYGLPEILWTLLGHSIERIGNFSATNRTVYQYGLNKDFRELGTKDNLEWFAETFLLYTKSLLVKTEP